MTCIVGVSHNGKTYLGGDSAAVGDSHYLTHDSSPKVFKKEGLLFGFTSSFAMGRALQYRLVVPTLPDGGRVVDMDRYIATAFADAVRACLKEIGYVRIDCGRETAGVFLVGARGNLWAFDDDFHARRPRCNFDACGSGVSVALGSLFSTPNMEPEDRCVEALSAAQQFVTTVREPFTVISG